MNTIKKIMVMISVILIFIFISLSTVCAKGKNLYEEDLVERLKIDTSEVGVSYIYEECFYYFSESNQNNPDYALIKAAKPVVGDAYYSSYFGEFVAYTCYYTPYIHAYHIYTPKDDKIYTLEEAYYAEVDGIEEALRFLNGKAVALVGDANADFKLNIKDATWIQKYIADYVELHEACGFEELTGKACDFNRDGRLNIRDATAIQKYLAKYETTIP